MATQPCPCGWRAHPERICRCSPPQIDRYLGKISGPLLDRIDIHVEISAVKFKELTSVRCGETSEIIRSRVGQARQRQLKRFDSAQKRENNSKADDSEPINASQLAFCNAQMTTNEIRRFCRINDQSHQLMELAMKKLGLSARAYDRILKVARTIADLENEIDIQAQHVAEAIQYRTLDRNHLTALA
jgi:magnesium chelatase family protein